MHTFQIPALMPFLRAIIFFFLSIVTIALTALHSASAAVPDVHRVTHQQHQTFERIILHSTKLRPAIQNTFLLNNPVRLVVDMQHLGTPLPSLPTLQQDGLITAIRFGHFSPKTSRIVMELSPQAKTHRIQSLNNQTLQIDILTEESPTVAPSSFIPQPIVKPQHAATSSHKPHIIIDAGHGGKDPGAIGRTKVLEKHITMAYANALKQALLNTHRYQVSMTRGGDRFIYLHERVKKARQANGDLFISIHADSAGESYARGISVYTVSEKASDSEAAKLAQKENEADRIGGIDFADKHPEVADILIDLASRDARIKATDLSSELVKQFAKAKITLLGNPARFAGFRVLKAPDIPSVLIEVGFLSNKTDEQILQTSTHRNKVVNAVIRAIDRYFVQHPLR